MTADSAVDIATAHPPTVAPTHPAMGRARPVAVWLFAVAALVFAMVVVGGATRLTGSGLSITQWRPVSGVLPPLTASGWARALALYRGTPQYRLINAGMSLREFQSIFWWEWAHRLLGRLVGAAFAIPFVVFLARRQIPRRLAGPCALLLALGALQGLVGWWMVVSGLEGRTAVAPERLAVHLGLALFLYGALLWTGLEAWVGEGQRARSRWTAPAVTLLAGVFFQCLLGALLAGSRGGLIDNDWPFMAGRLFPPDYWRGSLAGSVLEGPAASQFDHRIGAYAVLAAALALAAWAQVRVAPRVVRRMTLVLAVAVSAQAVLGVATLRLIDPLALAIVHQAGAAVALAMAVATAWISVRYPDTAAVKP